MELQTCRFTDFTDAGLSLIKKLIQFIQNWMILLQNGFKN